MPSDWVFVGTDLGRAQRAYRLRRMRKYLLAAGAVVALSVPAFAQDAVYCTNCTDQVTTVLNDAAVAANWVTQIAYMEHQLTQQIAIFQQLSGLTNVNGMAAVLNQAGNFNAMNSYGNVPQMLQGNGFGNIGSTSQGFLTQSGNQLPLGSPIPVMNMTNTIFNNRAGSLANVQGIATCLLATSNTILNGLMQLQHLIDQQPNVQQMGGMSSRLASYQGNINSQQFQLAQMKAFADAQEKVFEQQQQRAGYCADLNQVNSTQSLTGAGANVGTVNCAIAGGAPPGAAVNGVAVAGVAGGVTTVGGDAVDNGGFDTPVTTNPAGGTAVAANALPTPPVAPAAGDPNTALINTPPEPPTDDGIAGAPPSPLYPPGTTYPANVPLPSAGGPGFSNSDNSLDAE